VCSSNLGGGLDPEPQRYEFTSGIKFSPRAVRVELESAC